MSVSAKFNRRRFLQSATMMAGTLALPAAHRAASASQAPAVITRDSVRPQLLQGLQIGDVSRNGAMIWSRSDRPSRMLVEYSLDESFKNPVKIRGPYALESTDFTARLDLTSLPSGRDIWVRVGFQDLSNESVLSELINGRLRTAPSESRAIRFVWSGDTAGQGWGINPDFGGMKIYEAMRQQSPDFFIHSGDTVYADGPIQAEVTAENGELWKNIVTEEVSKVAESMAEFRGRYKYNMLDNNVRAFNAEVPQIWQWDDHEVVNNWSAAKDLTDDDRYKEKNVPLLIARGTQAFREFAPMRTMDSRETDRVYRKVSYGPMLDVFVLDMRSYRAANSANRQEEPSEETRFLGAEQLAWLKRSLSESKAVWKAIASDMPIGLQVRDGDTRFENLANGDGPALGREHEIADLLRYINAAPVKNIVLFTADVHYCAAHYYNPDKAQFQDFSPFWEFVTGPLNAGSFGPNTLDNTFGPEVVFQKAPPAANYSPFAGLQFFGQVDIDPDSREMTVALKDLDNKNLFTQVIQAESV